MSAKQSLYFNTVADLVLDHNNLEERFKTTPANMHVVCKIFLCPSLKE